MKSKMTTTTTTTTTTFYHFSVEKLGCRSHRWLSRLRTPNLQMRADLASSRREEPLQEEKNRGYRVIFALLSCDKIEIERKRK